MVVFYTQAARAANGGTAQTRANVDAQIALTNAIYANSNVTHRVRLVYKGEVQYREANMDTDLSRLTATDGYMDEIQVLRNQYGADLVSLWGVYADYCGLGWLLQTEASSFASLGYNVVASPACTAAGQYTFAHELGHNMGLRHDKFVDAAATVVSPEGTASLSTIGYAHGYVDLTQRFRTVMAYEDQCTTSSISCPRVPYFSNPALTYNTAPLGDAANAHEQRALNHTRETVANFGRRYFLAAPSVFRNKARLCDAMQNFIVSS